MKFPTVLVGEKAFWKDSAMVITKSSFWICKDGKV